MSLLEKLGLKEGEDQKEENSQPEAKELDFKGRVREERLQLANNVSKLESFIATAPFRALTRPDKLDLKSQLKYMKLYLSILDRRIARF